MDPEVQGLYGEARRAQTANAPTACVMICRKILMNFAVSRGCKGNEKFAHYVDWLAKEGYVPPGGKDWVKAIKDVGNEANHEIPDIDPRRAALVLKFTEMLLRLNYEMASDLEELAGETG